MRLLFILLLSFTLALFGCKQTKTNQTSPTDEVKQDIPFVSIKKTPCYGKCPAYIADIYEDGHILFQGKSFVDFIGDHTGTITTDDVQNIKDKIIAISFFELKDKYDSNVTDFPSCILDVNMDGKSKSILDRVGGPKELKELENLIHELVLNSSLTKVEK
ncbi:MAG: hypothetical protein H6587_11190 [Flavobacteriales bacterium]|nr:hypothetical protein [Bacteroidota bacterium]MCB9361594.1 hypothetical protein [Flavobacteriales bacterium]MCB9365124.1 hypothetical protein [Flavobacteriales bacterium]